MKQKVDKFPSKTCADWGDPSSLARALSSTSNQSSARMAKMCNDAVDACSQLIYDYIWVHTHNLTNQSVLTTSRNYLGYCHAPRSNAELKGIGRGKRNVDSAILSLYVLHFLNIIVTGYHMLRTRSYSTPPATKNIVFYTYRILQAKPCLRIDDNFMIV